MSRNFDSCLPWDLPARYLPLLSSHHSCELCQHTGVERQRHKVWCGDGGQFQISDLPFTSPLTIGSVLNLSKAPLPYM